MDNNRIIENNSLNKKEFVKDIKVNSQITDYVIKKKNFLEEIKGNKKLINMLSVERLKKLEKYYDSIIEENNRKIKKLKSEV